MPGLPRPLALASPAALANSALPRCRGPLPRTFTLAILTALALSACGGSNQAITPSASAPPPSISASAIASPSAPAPSRGSSSPASLQPSPSRAASPASSASGTTALDPAASISLEDDNKTIQIRVGQVVDLALQADQGMDDWQVTNPDAKILQPTVNPAFAAPKGMTLRAFKATAPGTATITATDRPTCNPGQVCSRLIRAFKATVVVTG